MDKQIVVLSYNGILLSNVKEEELIYITTWMNLKSFILSLESQFPMVTY